MPERTDPSDALLGPHPKCREPAFWADLSRLAIDTATPVTENFKIASTTSWRDLEDAEQLLIIFSCESLFRVYHLLHNQTKAINTAMTDEILANRLMKRNRD